MPDELRRSVVLADETRVVQKYVGPSKTFAEPGWDAPQYWEDEFALKPGEILSGWVQPTGDVNAMPHPSGAGVIIEIGGMRHGIPSTLVPDLLASLQDAHGQAQELAVAAQAAAEAATAAASDTAPLQEG